MAGAQRRCLSCGYTGEMKLYMATNEGQAIGCVLLLFLLVPGIIFMAWGQGKYRCPQCSAVGKSTADLQAGPATSQTGPRAERACPWCAEPILKAAKVCKHCGRDVSRNA